MAATVPFAPGVEEEGVAHRAKARALPGEGGIWLFIAGDLSIFSQLFLTYFYYRAQQPALYSAAQQHLDQGLGMLNTALMLTSSLFVALAVHAARRGMAGWPSRLYWLAALCGVGFGVIKIFEYGAKISHGITLTTNDMFMFYFILTGTHMLHVMMGIGVLLFLANYCRGTGDGRFTPAALRTIECGSLFWHVVDLLWIILFALLYLIR